MKSFTRHQLREVLEAWMREPETEHSQEDSLYYKGVAAFFSYLDTYQFNGNGGHMRATGTVKWFNEKKGFGFIVPDEGGDDVFVHSTGLQSGLKIKEGDKVEFDLGKTSKGLSAVDVSLL